MVLHVKDYSCHNETCTRFPFLFPPLSLSLSVCWYVCQSLSLSVSLISPSLPQDLNLSVCLHLSVCLSLSLLPLSLISSSLPQDLYLYVCLSACLSVMDIYNCMILFPSLLFTQLCGPINNEKFMKLTLCLFIYHKMLVQIVSCFLYLSRPHGIIHI